MKAAVFYGQKNLKVEEIDLPPLKQGEILVKVKACGICGTDVHIFSGEEGSAKVTHPVILGHEFCGEVVETKSSLFKIGDKVSIDPNIYCGVCKFCRSGKIQLCENLLALGVNLNGGFAEYAVVPEKQAIVFEDISFEEAALAEPLACCLHGIEKLEIKATDKVLIIGLGPIGLIMLEILKLYGVYNLYGYEIDDFRKEVAKGQGIKDIIEESTDERFDIVIECAGTKESIEMAFEKLEKGGQLLVFSVPSPKTNVLINPFEMFKKEAKVYWSFVNPFTQKLAIELLESKKINLKHLITHKISLKELSQALNKRYEKQLKVIVQP
ncbi:zinc-dependent alcohol dehydrogenase family protein [Caldicellulosiruptor naganoensis]|uniref:Zinc-dependent alcohol dehydrogenase family protein n=1 Tax=Caldicellulosiruptor naganoensis TaxID=29324 RepID=A0ABY7BGN9_9FIRM|nr:zinc-dependent alcohol dehydrogenase family protein [Caldicellulosiruptor naganoensis]WAM31256.1 zinc-dependent alcohol dehydrogenase family protein [Caldicellulosiruptor naganoensis]